MTLKLKRRKTSSRKTSHNDNLSTGYMGGINAVGHGATVKRYAFSRMNVDFISGPYKGQLDVEVITVIDIDGNLYFMYGDGFVPRNDFVPVWSQSFLVENLIQALKDTE